MIRLDQWRAVCYPYVEGTRPDTRHRADVEMTAETLAVLHDSPAALTRVSLAPVAALEERPDGALGGGQLIHGDYAATNLVVTSSGLKVDAYQKQHQSTSRMPHSTRRSGSKARPER